MGGTPAWTRDGGQASIGGSALELSAVTKTYGPVRALVSVSCRFETGQIGGRWPEWLGEVDALLAGPWSRVRKHSLRRLRS